MVYEERTSGAKAQVNPTVFMYELKPVPFTRRSLALVTSTAFLLLLLTTVAGCHSYHIDMTVENRTGGAIQLLEVEYPSASFGANSLAAGEMYRYRIQLRGSGSMKVQYTGANGQQVQIDGPVLAEPQEGRLGIVLLPAGKAEFYPEPPDALIRIKPNQPLSGS